MGAAVIYPGSIHVLQDLPGVDSGAPTIHPGIIWEGVGLYFQTLHRVNVT